MTRRERFQIAWFVLACCLFTGTINWAIANQAQEQPRLRLRGDFDVIPFDNGSVWYVRQGAIQAIWAVPRDQQERLGMATKVYGAGFEINCPDEVTTILEKVYAADMAELNELQKRIQEVRQANE